MTPDVAVGERGIRICAKTVEHTLDRLYQCSESHDRPFKNLYELVCWPKLLAYAAYRVLGNHGAFTPGVDKETKGKFLRTFGKQIELIREELKSPKGYKPDGILRRYIPKKNGKLRPLGLPTLRDKVVQEAIRLILEPIYEPRFLACSHGFRPGHSTQDCRKDIGPALVEGKRNQYVLEGDIEGFFDNVDHGVIWNLLGLKIHDRKFRTLIHRFLKAEILENGNAEKPKKGMPQGGVISPILSNIYLHELDKFVEELKLEYADLMYGKKDGWYLKRKPDGFGGSICYSRYADDWVIIWNGSKAILLVIKARIAQFLKERLKLNLSESKTKISDVEDGFAFVGFVFQRRVLSNSVKGVTGGGSVIKKGMPFVGCTKENLKKFHRSISQVLREATRKGYGPSYAILKVNEICRGILNYYAEVTFAGSLKKEVRRHALTQFWYYLKRRGVNPSHFMTKVDGRRTYHYGRHVLQTEVTRKVERYHRLKKGFCKDTHGSRYMQRAKKNICGRWFPNDPIVPFNNNWRDLRDQTLDRDGYKCVHCGQDATQVHHRLTKEQAKYDKQVWKDRDKVKYLESVCTGCHLKLHGKKSAWSIMMEDIERINDG